jgi:hypothetical protein|tara:strand:+ start:100 stop:339 length:240 start_codon:yes stop_codon:yes gene_type:complete
MNEVNLIGWICSSAVIFLLLFIVAYEIIKRWRLVLRLAALDEKLLHDKSISIETVIDSPPGSKIIPQIPAYPILENKKL